MTVACCPLYHAMDCELTTATLAFMQLQLECIRDVTVVTVSYNQYCYTDDFTVYNDFTIVTKSLLHIMQ